MVGVSLSRDACRLLFNIPQRLQYLVNLLSAQCPRAPGKFSNHCPFEPMVEVECLSVIAAMVSKDGERQLGGTTAAVTPFKSGRTVIPQVQPGIQAATIHSDDDGIALAPSGINLH